MISKFLLFAATFLLASCVAIERNNPDDPGSANYGRSVPTQNVVYGDPVDYEGEIYETVVIGEQTWLKRNLNYTVEGSKCYNNSDANCKTYGKLYNWEMAMAVCPPDWHLPSNDEWTKLRDFVGGPFVGVKLMATSGWVSYLDESKPPSNPGEDTFGFSALPGGYSNWASYDYFDYLGRTGFWWTATDYIASSAYRRDISSSGGTMGNSEGVDKRFFFSVRCVKD